MICRIPLWVSSFAQGRGVKAAEASGACVSCKAGRTSVVLSAEWKTSSSRCVYKVFLMYEFCLLLYLNKLGKREADRWILCTSSVYSFTVFQIPEYVIGFLIDLQVFVGRTLKSFS